jgi:L-2-hydroxyglutarate oxidase LhgO
MADQTDVLIIGAGVVGLAIAQELARSCGVVVVERRESYGLETSSHNSGVVHAGIYYPRDWLKTSLCIEGNRLLYAWADEHGVRFRRTGKLIIAVDESEIPALDVLHESSLANGVPDLRMIGREDVARLEPSITGVAAIFSGTSGVVDQMELMKSFARAAESNGAMIAYKHDVVLLERGGDGFIATMTDPSGERTEIDARTVVNSAGIEADAIAAMLAYPLMGSDASPRMKHVLCKGRYYDIVTPHKAKRLSHLVYPLPHGDRAGLGVHVTLDVDGGVHLGPDTEWLGDGRALDYRSSDDRREEFVGSARRFLPWIEPDDIAPGQVGYRTKLHGPGESAADFLLWQDSGYVHLGGIESPGMTASLAIAARVAAMVEGTA